MSSNLLLNFKLVEEMEINLPRRATYSIHAERRLREPKESSRSLRYALQD